MYIDLPKSSQASLKDKLGYVEYFINFSEDFGNVKNVLKFKSLEVESQVTYGEIGFKSQGIFANDS